MSFPNIYPRRASPMAQQQKDPALLTGAYNAWACTAYFQGDFEAALQYATRGAQIWRSGGMVNRLKRSIRRSCPVFFIRLDPSGT